MTYEELDKRLSAIKNELVSLTAVVLDSKEYSWQRTRMYNHLIKAGNELFLARDVIREAPNTENCPPICPDN